MPSFKITPEELNPPSAYSELSLSLQRNEKLMKNAQRQLAYDARGKSSSHMEHRKHQPPRRSTDKKDKDAGERRDRMRESRHDDRNEQMHKHGDRIDDPKEQMQAHRKVEKKENVAHAERKPEVKVNKYYEDKKYEKKVNKMEERKNARSQGLSLEDMKYERNERSSEGKKYQNKEPTLEENKFQKKEINLDEKKVEESKIEKKEDNIEDNKVGMKEGNFGNKKNEEEGNFGNKKNEEEGNFGNKKNEEEGKLEDKKDERKQRFSEDRKSEKQNNLEDKKEERKQRFSEDRKSEKQNDLEDKREERVSEDRKNDEQSISEDNKRSQRSSERKRSERKRRSSKDKNSERKRRSSKDKNSERKRRSSKDKNSERKRRSSKDKKSQRTQSTSDDKRSERKRRTSENKKSEKSRRSSEGKKSERKRRTSEDKKSERKKRTSENNKSERKKRTSEGKRYERDDNDLEDKKPEKRINKHEEKKLENKATKHHDKKDEKHEGKKVTIQKSNDLVEHDIPSTEEFAVTRLDAVVFIVILAEVIGFVAVGLEIYAYSLDQEWNSVLNGDNPIAELEHHHVFSQKTFRLDGHLYLTKAREYASRNEPEEIVFIVIILILVLVTFVQLCACYIKAHDVEQYAALLIGLYAIGGAVAMFCSTLLIVASTNIENSFTYAADMLHNYRFINVDPPIGAADQDKCQHELLNGCDMYEFAKLQSWHLEQIFRHCGSGSRFTRYYRSDASKTSIKVFDEVYYRSELKEIGFCSRDGYKFVAAACAFLMGILFAIVPVIFCCEGKAEGKKSAYDDPLGDTMKPMNKQGQEQATQADEEAPIRFDPTAVLEQFRAYVEKDSESEKQATVTREK